MQKSLCNHLGHFFSLIYNFLNILINTRLICFIPINYDVMIAVMRMNILSANIDLIDQSF